MCATAFGGHDDLKVAHVGVQRGVEDALLGHLSGEDHRLVSSWSQQVRQRRRVERAVADLLQEPHTVLGHDRLDEVAPLTLERLTDQVLLVGGEVAVVVVDIDEVDIVAFACLGDEPGDGLDDVFDARASAFRRLHAGSC